ncbi:IPExxxVDY family protein [Psychroflexus sp. MBR-150]|jgi:D-hexose-6-phosphate mutarotase
MPKLVLNKFTDFDFKLIGLNASIEPFKMAFLLNKHLEMQFERTKEDVELIYKNYCIFFALYTYYDVKADTKLYFVQNKSKYINLKPEQTTSLFDNQSQVIKKHLVESKLQSDYLIKIEDEFNRYKTKKLIIELNEIPQLISAYEIKTDSIKSPENLIFE